MVKTTPLDEKTHMFFKKTQMALFEKYKIKTTMSDLMADISYALRHPEDAAKLILSARREKQEKVISGESVSKDKSKEGGLVFVKSEVGGISPENIGGNILKPSKITLVDKEDIHT